MLQSASADTKKATARGNSQPQAQPVGLQAPPVPVLGYRSELRLQRKCDCGGGPNCDCDTGDNKKNKEKDSPRTALHRKPAGVSSLLDPDTQSFFEARALRRAPAPAVAPQSGPPIHIGAVDDPLEREADHIAHRVLRMPDNTAQAAGLPAVKNGSPLLRKATSAPTQPSALPQPQAPPIVHSVLSSPGQPLDRPTRSFFEPRFGQDLSHVRIHNDSKAAESARAVDALAFTHGNNIVFASGIYRPQRPDGRFILAHELAHTMQQGRQQTIRRTIKSSPTAPLDSYLRGKNILGFTSSNGVYALAMGIQATSVDQEILLNMLASARLFEIAGNTSSDAEKSLTDHQTTRLGIVAFAAKKTYRFASISGFQMNPKYWDVDMKARRWKTKQGVDPQEARDDVNVNPGEYAIGCQAATIITKAGGSKGAQFRDSPTQDEKDWVPGEAGYIANPSHPDQNDPGTLGENLIYAGLGQFWGHLPGSIMYRTLDEWKTAVASWNGSAQVDTQRDGPTTGLV